MLLVVLDDHRIRSHTVVKAAGLCAPDLELRGSRSSLSGSPCKGGLWSGGLIEDQLQDPGSLFGLSNMGTV